MGMLIQIRRQGDLIIPKDAEYTPPMEWSPEAISLSFRDMSTLISIMHAAGVMDTSIETSKMKKNTRPGCVPIYKFAFNDGYVVTAKEAQRIADAFAECDVFEAAFLREHFPKNDFSRPDLQDLLERPRQLVALWVAFNRVTAANNGYTVK